jgi:hypothetical protein
MGYDKIKAGEPIGGMPALSASFNNDCIDVIQAFKASELGGPASGTGLNFPTDIIKIQNSTGDDLARGSVLRIGSYLLDEDDPGSLWFDGTAVDTTFSPLFAILREPIIDGEIGQAYTGGVCAAVCDTTPVAGESRGPKPGQSTLAKGFPGCIVLDVVDSSNKIAIVRMQSPITSLTGKASGAVTARSGTTPGDGAITIVYNNAGTLTDAGFEDLDVKNITDSSLVSGDYCEVSFIGGEWWIVKGGGSTVKIYSTTLTADMASGDTTATVNTTYAGRAGASDITGDGTVENRYSIAGLSGDRVIVQREGSGYEITQVQHHLCGS